MDEEIKKEEGQEESQESEKPLDRMTTTELREIAREIPGVTGVHALKKEGLLAIIKESRGIKDEAPAKRTKKKPDKPTLNIKGLKKKIVELRKEKEAAREGGDRHRVDILRRCINRMKKQTRRIAQA